MLMPRTGALHVLSTNVLASQFALFYLLLLLIVFISELSNFLQVSIDDHKPPVGTYAIKFEKVTENVS